MSSYINLYICEYREGGQSSYIVPFRSNVIISYISAARGEGEPFLMLQVFRMNCGDQKIGESFDPWLKIQAAYQIARL
jgi:hypothetical protein